MNYAVVWWPANVAHDPEILASFPSMEEAVQDAEDRIDNWQGRIEVIELQ